MRLLFVSVSVMCGFTQDNWKMYPYTVEERVFIVRTFGKQNRQKIMSTAIPEEVWRQMMATSSICYDFVTFFTQ
jgi:hypothetical protein